MNSTALRIDPELRAALVELSNAYAARGIRVGWTALLRRAATAGLPQVRREALGGLA
jgi:hypothetical protein